MNSNYVPALPAARPQTPVVNLPYHPIEIDGAMSAVDGAIEKTSGIDRSAALIIRFVPITIVWLVLAVSLSWASGAGFSLAICLFAGLTACTYAYLDTQDRRYSRNGLERHRVDTYASLKLSEMEHQQELRKMALQAHLKMLGVQDDK